jgi:hypothetical protein
MKTYSIYVKRLPNGSLYLGRTQENPYLYLGSGTIWKRAIKKHGYTVADIETWVLHTTPNLEEVKEFGVYYSKLFNVVKSNMWLNLVEESGQGLTNPSEELRQRLSKAKLGVRRKPFTEQTKNRISEGLKGRKLSEEHRLKITEINKSQKEREKRSKALKGHVIEDSTKEKIAERIKQLWKDGYYSKRAKRSKK